MSTIWRTIKENIKRVYLTYNRPLIIGFSGGKDSSAVVQLLYEALVEMPREQLTQTIHIISTDTLVEIPYIVDYVFSTLSKVEAAAHQAGLPINCHRLQPTVEQSFWVSLLGKGYPAPSQKFRWCTERLKINPVNRFIREYVDEFGEVTIVLGARKSESSSRGQVMASRNLDPLGLTKHPTLPAAYVFTPIEDMSTDDVWEYLLSNQRTPWQTNNRDLAALYQNASGGECPLVVDKSTPTCGNSRFGCWVCTLVETDTSMENLVDGGESWMEPLLEYRDFLRETRRPDQKSKYRRIKRRDGRIYTIRDNSTIAYGPYTFKWRKELLRRLLQAQKKVCELNTSLNLTLISFAELETIRAIWKHEESDWEDSVPRLYESVYGACIEHEWHVEDNRAFGQSERKLLEDICIHYSVPADLVARLLDLEREAQMTGKRAGLQLQLQRVMHEDWRSELQVMNSLSGDHDH